MLHVAAIVKASWPDRPLGSLQLFDTMQNKKIALCLVDLSDRVGLDNLPPIHLKAVYYSL